MKDIISEALIFVAMLAMLAFFVLTGLCFVFGVIAFTETVANICAILVGISILAPIVATEIENF